MKINFPHFQSLKLVKKLYFVFLLLMLKMIACDKPYIDCEYPDYSNCITEEPQNGKLKVKLTVNAQNNAIPIVIYYGTHENDAICIIDTAYINEKEYVLPANVYYSVRATYKSGNMIVHAIDGGYLEKKSYKVCDSVCWVVKDVDLNLKLK